MNLKNIKNLRAEKGFTIVELLIVIVVIGILVAIVVVAYTGITQQANDQRYLSNAQSVRKVAEAWQARDGDYPDNTGEFTSQYSKLPNGVAVVTTPATLATNFADSRTAADAGNVYVDFCTTDGMRIYYPELSSSTIRSIAVGDTTAGC